MFNYFLYCTLAYAQALIIGVIIQYVQGNDLKECSQILWKGRSGDGRKSIRKCHIEGNLCGKNIAVEESIKISKF